MIRMIKGTYGLVTENGEIHAMTPESGPFSASKAEEATLVGQGVAKYEADPEKPAKESKPEKKSAKAADERGVGKKTAAKSEKKAKK